MGLVRVSSAVRQGNEQVHVDDGAIAMEGGRRGREGARVRERGRGSAGMGDQDQDLQGRVLHLKFAGASGDVPAKFSRARPQHGRHA